MNKNFIKNLDKIFIATILVALILFLIGIIPLMVNDSFVNKSEKTFGVVSHLQSQENGKKEYMLMYYANGEQFETVYKYANRNTYIGESVPVYYNEENPEEIFIRSAKIDYVLVYFSAALLAVAIVVYLPNKKKKELKQENVWVDCKVKSIQDGFLFGKKLILDSSKVPGRQGKPFYSHLVSNEYAKSVKNSMVTVYYHAKNPKIYYVDTKK